MQKRKIFLGTVNDLPIRHWHVNACHQVHTEVLIYFLSHAVTCADHPCQHDGVCNETINYDDGSYSCSCGAGYTGINCEITGNYVIR
jgi:hypothetical protein